MFRVFHWLQKYKVYIYVWDYLQWGSFFCRAMTKAALNWEMKKQNLGLKSLNTCDCGESFKRYTADCLLNPSPNRTLSNHCWATVTIDTTHLSGFVFFPTHLIGMRGTARRLTLYIWRVSKKSVFINTEMCHQQNYGTTGLCVHFFYFSAQGLESHHCFPWIPCNGWLSAQPLYIGTSRLSCLAKVLLPRPRIS